MDVMKAGAIVSGNHIWPEIVSMTPEGRPEITPAGDNNETKARCKDAPRNSRSK